MVCSVYSHVAKCVSIWHMAVACGTYESMNLTGSQFLLEIPVAFVIKVRPT